MTVRAIHKVVVGLSNGSEAWIHHGREYDDHDELVIAYPQFFEPVEPTAAPIDDVVEPEPEPDATDEPTADEEATDTAATPRIGRPPGSKSKPKTDV